jgi:hypothetical protein
LGPMTKVTGVNHIFYCAWSKNDIILIKKSNEAKIQLLSFLFLLVFLCFEFFLDFFSASSLSIWFYFVFISDKVLIHLIFLSLSCFFLPNLSLNIFFFRFCPYFLIVFLSFSFLFLSILFFGILFHLFFYLILVVILLIVLFLSFILFSFNFQFDPSSFYFISIRFCPYYFD